MAGSLTMAGPILSAIGDLPAAYHDASEWLIAVTGASHSTMHVNMGIGVFLLIQVLVNDRRASWLALGAVAYAELANEVLEFAYYGSWRLPDTLWDIAVTLVWPCAIVLVGRLRRRRWARHHAPEARGAVAMTSRLAPSR